MLYEVFERLIFGVSYVFLSRFGRYCVFVQVVLVISIWQGRTNGFVLDCGKGSVFDVCLSVWCWNLYGVWAVANGYVSFLVTVVSSLGSCYVPFAGHLWFMYPPRKIGLLMLTLDYLVQFSLLQRYDLVVGCCVLYWFVEFGTWLWYFMMAKTLFSCWMYVLD